MRTFEVSLGAPVTFFKVSFSANVRADSLRDPVGPADAYDIPALWETPTCSHGVRIRSVYRIIREAIRAAQGLVVDTPNNDGDDENDDAPTTHYLWPMVDPVPLFARPLGQG